MNRHYLLLTGFWLLAIVVINPIAEFPLNDDWVYAYPVYFLLKGLPFHFIDIQSMTLISQVGWGGLFCLPFGFSFTALRISSLIAAWIGVTTTYRATLLLTQQSNIAFWVAFSLLVNPLYFSLSFTFMTDVPFMVWNVLALYFFFKFLLKERLLLLLVATLFSVLAVLNRQSGLYIPLAFTAVYSLKAVFPKFSVSKLATAILPLAATIGGLLLFNFWIDHAQIRPDYLRGIEHAKWEMLWTQFDYRAGLSLLYVGLFLLPISVYALLCHWHQLNSKKRWIALTFSFIAAFLLFQKSYAGFPVGNIWYNMGLGPLTTFDALLLNSNNYKNGWSTNWIWIFRILMLVGAWLLSFNFFSTVLNLKWTRSFTTPLLSRFLIVAAIFIYVPLLVISETYFDRYFIPLIPLLAWATLPSTPFGLNRFGKFTFVVFFSMQFLFSLAATKDYFTWNKLRWKAALDLEAAQVEKQYIDGGYEYNGWHFGDVQVDKGEWFWTWGNRYLITKGNVANYQTFRIYPYQRLIPYQRDTIFVLKQ